jgi:hypothetical protein
MGEQLQHLGGSIVQMIQDTFNRMLTLGHSTIVTLKPRPIQLTRKNVTISRMKLVHLHGTISRPFVNVGLTGYMSHMDQEIISLVTSG